MPFLLIQGDITQLQVDAIVNAANCELKQGGGVCGAIFKAAGAQAMQKACSELAPIETGGVAITPGFALFSKYVIHTAGPVWTGGTRQEEELLTSCYRNALLLAHKENLQSIAFPLISAGIYGYPKDKAYSVATSTIRSFLESHDITVYLVLFEDAFCKGAALGKNKKLSAYIQKHQAFETNALTESIHFEIQACTRASLEPIVTDVEESFSQSLMRLISEKGLDEVSVYKGANIDRKHFSKIRSNDAYQPTKRTVMALALSLKLDAQETRKLLERAGYSLSHSFVFDIIVEYFIGKKLYDIHTINEVLFSYEQPLLGS